MREKLVKLLDNAYAPYSKFHVACVALMKDGKMIPGVNVENSSYGGAICAERNAITTAVAMGYKKGDFSKLYVMCDSERVSTSCFLCRQVINEFFDREDEVIFYSNDGDKKSYIVKDLCPYPFGSSDLK